MTQEVARPDKRKEAPYVIPDLPGANPTILRGLRSKKWPSHPGMIAEESIAPQLATPPGYQRDTDSFMEEILSNLNPTEVAWMSFADMIPRYAGGDFWKNLAITYGRRKRSQAGWTSKNIIDALGNLRGLSKPPQIARKPNIFSRNVTDRHWKEKAVEEGKEIVQD